MKTTAFETFLAENGLKYTQERRIILEAVNGMKPHFHAEALYEHIRRTHPIARATVFRNIPLLLESGVIQKSVGPDRKEYYERKAGKGHHDHMFCIQCHRVIEFCSPDIERAQEKVCAAYGFTMTFHDHRLYGICKQCSQQ